MFRPFQSFAAVAFLTLSGIVGYPMAYAGNVTIQVTQDAVLVTGDNANNAIHISGTDRGGVRFMGEIGTTINGRTGINMQITPRKPLVINLNGGDDHVIVNELTLPGSNLEVDLGRGADQFYLDFCGSFRAIRVVDGPADEVADDFIRIIDVEVTKSIEVFCGAGSDAVGVGLATMQDLFVETGSGNDGATIVFSEVFDAIDVAMGSGDDFTMVDGLLFASARFDGGIQTNRLADILPVGPLEGDIFMTLDFSLSTDGPENQLAFAAAVGFEHEYSFVDDIMGTDLEDAVFALMAEFDN